MMKCPHCDATVLTAAQPAQGRESVRQIAHKHCTCTCRDDPAVLQNHTNLCDSISDAILEYAVLSSAEEATSPPVFPTALEKTFEDHYWDTFQADRELIMDHVRAVLRAYQIATAIARAQLASPVKP